MILWRNHTAFWIPKATNAHSGCVKLIALPLQQWLYERSSILCYCALLINNHWVRGLDLSCSGWSPQMTCCKHGVKCQVPWKAKYFVISRTTVSFVIEFVTHLSSSTHDSWNFWWLCTINVIEITVFFYFTRPTPSYNCVVRIINCWHTLNENFS